MYFIETCRVADGNVDGSSSFLSISDDFTSAFEPTPGSPGLRPTRWGFAQRVSEICTKRISKSMAQTKGGEKQQQNC